MSAVPTYTNPCVVPDLSTPSSVFVMGISDTIPGRLELYRVNVANIQYPTATFLRSYTNATMWDATAEKFCDVFNGDTTAQPGPSVFIQQFGKVSTTAQVNLNGTISGWWINNSVKSSAKLFSPTGAINGHKWYTCTAPEKDANTNSVWRSYELASDYTKNAHVDARLSTYPPDDALLSVGTFTPSRYTPAPGHISVFGASGTSGSVFTTSSTQSDDTATRLQTLSNPVPIDMGGITLTKDAFPITLDATGYILDKTSSDTTVLYSIQPSTGSFKLSRVDVKGNVPPFIPKRATTTRGTQIILFGGLAGGNKPVATFSVYDTVTSSWTGPNLVEQPAPPPGPSPTPNGSESDKEAGSKSSTGAIVGGIVGAVVVLALIGFLFYRNKKNKTGRGKHQIVSQTQTDPAAPATQVSQVVHSAPHISGGGAAYAHVASVAPAAPEFYATPAPVTSVPPTIFQPQPVPQSHYYEPPTLVQGVPVVGYEGHNAVDYGSPTFTEVTKPHSPPSVVHTYSPGSTTQSYSPVSVPPLHSTGPQSYPPEGAKQAAVNYCNPPNAPQYYG